MKLLLLSIILLLSSSVSADINLLFEAREKNVELSDYDEKVIKMGHTGRGKYITGAILGTYPIGFGFGHIIQGNWSHKGWIFTAGQLASLAILSHGIGKCGDEYAEDSESCNNSTLYIGATGFLAFKIWEIIDLWMGVPKYNQRYKELKLLINSQTTKVSFIPIIRLDNGAGVGINFTF